MISVTESFRNAGVAQGRKEGWQEGWQEGVRASVQQMLEIIHEQCLSGLLRREQAEAQIQALGKKNLLDEQSAQDAIRKLKN